MPVFAWRTWLRTVIGRRVLAFFVLLGIGFPAGIMVLTFYHSEGLDERATYAQVIALQQKSRGSLWYYFFRSLQVECVCVCG